MAKCISVALVALMATACMASSLKEKRQIENNNIYNNNANVFQCPGDGPFPNQADCSSFFQCYEGRASLISCSKGLEFNPENNWCDFPANNVNNNCQRTAASAGDQLCLNNRADISGVYFVAHPGYCNAFFTCGNGRVDGSCTFCAGGQVFNTQTGRCENIAGLPEEQVNGLCGSRTFVRPEEQAVRRLDASCNLETPNPYQPLFDKITQGNGGAYNANNQQRYQQQGGRPYQQQQPAQEPASGRYFPNEQ